MPAPSFTSSYGSQLYQGCGIWTPGSGSGLGVGGVRKEQLLAVDLVAADVALSLRGNQPVNELLTQILLDRRIPLRTDQHDTILVKQALVALNGNDKLALVLERKPRAAICQNVRIVG